MKDAARPAIRHIGQARDDQQGEQQRAELRETDRIDHRIKQLGLDPLEGKQRQIGGDDDCGGEEDRPRHLPGRVANVGFGERLVRLCLAPPQYRFRHHDGAVDDDAEVDGAERQQVGRNSAVVHQDEGHHHGERNGDADDQGAARAAEEENEDDEHQADAREHRVRDLVDRCS